MNDDLMEFLSVHAPELVDKLRGERREKVSVYRQYEQRIAELEAKIEQVRGLSEKWRVISPDSALFVYRICADELEAMLKEE